MWSIVLVTDLDGTPLGQLRSPTERRLSYRLRRAAAASFQIRTTDPLADALLEGEVLVKFYESDPSFKTIFGAEDQLRFVGEVTSAEEVGSGEEDSLAIVATDPIGELDQRLIGKDAAGALPGSGAFSRTDTARTTIAQDLVNAVNAEGGTGLRIGAVTAQPATTTVGPWNYKPAGESLLEVATPLDGFEFLARPIEPASDASGIYWGLLDMAPAIGAIRPDAIFEFGGGWRSNVKSFRRPVTKQGMANVAYSLPEGFPTAEIAGDTVLSQSDADSIARWRRREAVVASDLSVAALRQRLVDANVAIRSEPRQTIAFESVPVGFERDGRAVPVPHFMVDYVLGDVVIFRAIRHGRVRANLQVRVYGVDIAISPNGLATPTLSVQPSE